MSPKLEVRLVKRKGGYGLFAHTPIKTGELLVVWGGTVVHTHDLQELEVENIKIVQIEDDLYLVSDRNGPGDYINHCCDPNGGIRGTVSVVALRDIAADEEVCYDYAMTESSDYENFDCSCGAPNCRGHVTGDDWQRPDLQEHYNGYFSVYLQRKIEAWQAVQLNPLADTALATNGHL